VLGRVERADSVESTLDVPEEYWDKLRERTGYMEQNVDDFDHLEQLLSDRQFERLMNKIE